MPRNKESRLVPPDKMWIEVSNSDYAKKTFQEPARDLQSHQLEKAIVNVRTHLESAQRRFAQLLKDGDANSASRMKTSERKYLHRLDNLLEEFNRRKANGKI